MRVSTIALLLAVWLASRVAPAFALSPAEWKIRQDLIKQMNAAHDGNDHPKALSLAKRAGDLEMTPSLRYFMAREEEELGLLADSFSHASQCALEAERDAKLRNRATVLGGCREIEQRLKDRVGHVVVAVPHPPDGLKVSLSGQELNNAALNIPYVITPGTITIEASAPNHTPYRLEISVPEGKTINVTVSLAPVPPKPDETVAADVRTPEPAPPPLTLPTPPATTPTVVASATPAPVDAGNRPDRTAALAVAIAGGAVMLGGGIVWAISDSKYDSLKQSCATTTGCTGDDYDSGTDTVRMLDRVAVGAFIAGGVMTVGGVVYYLVTGRRPSADTARLSIDPLGHAFTIGVGF